MGKPDHKIDCLNHKIRNFTTYLLTWKKKHRLEGKFTERMVQHYKALVRKLINEKSYDKEYFVKHVHNTLSHLTGHHEDCDQFYCHEDYIFPPMEISKAAYDELQMYLQRITNKVDRLKEGATSNLAEAFFAVVCKFDHGKIKNFIQGNNYKLRSFCAALSFNQGPTWNYDLIRKYLQIDSSVMESFFQSKANSVYEE